MTLTGTYPGVNVINDSHGNTAFRSAGDLSQTLRVSRENWDAKIAFQNTIKFSGIPYQASKLALSVVLDEQLVKSILSLQ